MYPVFFLFLSFFLSSFQLQRKNKKLCKRVSVCEYLHTLCNPWYDFFSFLFLLEKKRNFWSPWLYYLYIGGMYVRYVPSECTACSINGGGTCMSAWCR